MTLARVGGLMTFAPFLGSGAIAPVIRVFLSVVISLAIFPAVQADVPSPPPEALLFLLALGMELGIGFVLGLVGQLFLAGIQLGGQLMGFQMGFSLINIIDPQTQVESSALALLHNLIALLVFLAVNAHHWYIQAIADSYRILPGAAHYSSELAAFMLQLFGNMFILGFKLGAPIVTVLLIVDVLMGIIGRAAPQIHILIVGLPSKSLVGFLFLLATAHVSVTFMGRHLERLSQDLYTLLGMMAG